MKNRTYIAAAIQMDSQLDKDENLEAARVLVAEAAERGAQIAALPEMFSYHGSDIVGEAENVCDGKTFLAMSRLAKEKKIWINCGTIFEKNEAEPNRPFNSCMLIAPDGTLAAKYHKMHLFDVDLGVGSTSFRESKHKAPGDEIRVVDTEECGRLGLSICYDVRFPELYRLLALNGAEVIFVPASFELATGKDHWKALLCARAIENSCYVIAPAQIGAKPRSIKYGKSLIVDPWGNIIAMAPDKPCVITAEIDLDYREKIKRQVLTLENRRKDVYSICYKGKAY